MRTQVRKRIGTNKSSIIVTAPTGSTVTIQNQDGTQKNASGKKSRNLWNYSILPDKTTEGYTFRYTEEGVRITGTGNGKDAYGGTVSIDLEPGIYTVCGNANTTLFTEVCVTSAGGTNTYYKDGSTFTVDGTEAAFAIKVKINDSSLEMNTLYKPMLAAGAENIPFEPYYEGSRWTFRNCDIGSWTVYASKGDQSATATVEITEEGQLMRYEVNIAYKLQPSDFIFYTTSDLTTTAILDTDYKVVNDIYVGIPHKDWGTVENWRIQALVTLYCVPKKGGKIDVFCLGGGSCGSRCGGAGGYTSTQKGIYIIKGEIYAIIVGSGSSATNHTNGSPGGQTSAFGVTANGGAYKANSLPGVNGGSGSGAFGNGPGGQSYAGNGGTDGGNGKDGKSSDGNVSSGGIGQGTTTREFGEPTGRLYADGGGGGGRGCTPGNGGTYGGKGEYSSTGSTTTSKATSGVENTGSGGGGNWLSAPGNGGSGIVVFRNARGAA